MAAQLANQVRFFQARDGSIHQMLAKAGAAWRARRIYRATAAELRGLSVRELEDIGLAGEDTDTVARKAVYGM